MVRRKYLVESPHDDVIDDPETGLVAMVLYPRPKKRSLWRRWWAWMSRLSFSHKPELPLTAPPADAHPPAPPEGQVRQAPAAARNPSPPCES